MSDMLLNNRIRKLDFQDLVIFQLIHELKSVTEVAERLSVSQSTVSYCLKSLRDCFDDDLFINTRQGMAPTQRAETLQPKIRDIIGKMSECLNDESVDMPVADRSSFTIYAPEYFEILLMPELVRNIMKTGLRVTINIKPPGKGLPYEDLISGRIDLAILYGPGFYRAHAGLVTQTLFDDQLLGVYDGVGGDEPLTLDEMLAYEHVFPTPWMSDSSMVDNWLNAIGHQRTIVARANGYYPALNLLAGTDLLLMLPKRIHDRFRVQHPEIGARPAPPGLPNFTLDAAWSASLTNTPANVWLREQLFAVCAGFRKSESQLNPVETH